MSRCAGAVKSISALRFILFFAAVLTAALAFWLRPQLAKVFYVYIYPEIYMISSDHASFSKPDGHPGSANSNPTGLLTYKVMSNNYELALACLRDANFVFQECEKTIEETAASLFLEAPRDLSELRAIECDVLSEGSGSRYVLVAPAPALQRPASNKTAVVMLHGRGSSPFHMMGICDATDYTNNAMAVWNELGAEVHAINVSRPRGYFGTRHEEEARLQNDLAQVAIYLSWLQSHDFAVIMYGISYGDVLANALIESGLVSNIKGQVSVGGVWRSDSPDDRTQTIDNANYRYYSEAMSLHRDVPVLISSSSYDWWKVSKETKQKLLAAQINREVRLHLFRGMHESDPTAEFRLVEEWMGIE